MWRVGFPTPKVREYNEQYSGLDGDILGKMGWRKERFFTMEPEPDYLQVYPNNAMK